jgi:hypothetical protein
MIMSRRTLIAVSVIGVFVVFVLGMFARVYLITRRDRVLSAVCVPLHSESTKVYFSAPAGRYLGWFSSKPELHKSIWEPHCKLGEGKSVSVVIGGTVQQTPAINDYGSFSFQIRSGCEFMPSELTVTGKDSTNGHVYVNIAASF